jgi:glycosyltransferase involved in cell wall biosynthesis
VASSGVDPVVPGAAPTTLQPEGATLSGACGILIPAYNEASTIAGVVRMAKAAALGPVLVVDDGSTDATATTARDAGAAVLSLSYNQGKGGAVYHGVRALRTDIVVLLDADLIGLTPEHLTDLAAPVLSGAVDMSRGVFVGGRWRTSAAQHLAPQLNGQRAVRRYLLLDVPGLARSRYGLEVAITEHAKQHGWKSQDVPMPNVSQVMKEEKLGFLRGLGKRLGMYRDILRAYVKRR